MAVRWFLVFPRTLKTESRTQRVRLLRTDRTRSSLRALSLYAQVGSRIRPPAETCRQRVAKRCKGKRTEFRRCAIKYVPSARG
jgi:hypothetical protein